MATIAEAPPSYDSVIGKVDADVKADPSFTGLQKAFASLNESEKAILASHNPGPLTLDPDQEREFRKGFAKGFAQAHNHLQWSAQECATMCKKAAEDFLAVANKLSAISSQDGSQASKDLVTDFVALEQVGCSMADEMSGLGADFMLASHQRYRSLLTSSRLSAVKVAQQADRTLHSALLTPTCSSPN